MPALLDSLPAFDTISGKLHAAARALFMFGMKPFKLISRAASPSCVLSTFAGGRTAQASLEARAVCSVLGDDLPFLDLSFPESLSALKIRSGLHAKDGDAPTHDQCWPLISLLPGLRPKLHRPEGM
jgi:hypothetical protein